MKSGKPHRAVAIGLVVCSSVATFYVNTTTIHGKEAYDPLQPATIETSVPDTTVYADPPDVSVSKASKPKAKKPPVTTVVTTVAPVVTIAPTTTVNRDRNRDDDDDEKDD